MTTMTHTAVTTTRPQEQARHHMPFLLQVTTMTWRNLVTIFRVPAAIIPSLVISIFFLLVYEATLGRASGFLPGLGANSYLGFILPLSVVSAALGGSGVAGQAIVRDIENGYFDKLLLTPVSRAALLLGAMIAGAVILVIQTLLVLLVGILMGLQSETGVVGLLVLVGFALLLGTAFAGLTVGVALRTGNAGATQGASFLFFPLSFLTATFVPVELLDGWIRTAAEINPVTYILNAMRMVLNTGFNGEVILQGLLAAAAMGAVLFFFAWSSLRVRTRRR